MQVQKNIRAIKPSELPSPPQAAMQLMRACAKTDINNQELARLARADPVLTAELLRVVNSPFFGMGREISNIANAITVLGQRALRNLVLCISVRDALRPDAIDGFDSTSFWEDDLRRATAARMLAESIHMDPDDCFTAGLLQDFGLLVMFYVRPEVSACWHDYVKADPEERYELEMEHFGVTHDQVSLMLARGWSLPEDFTLAIGYHHRCAELEEKSRAHSLCRVLYCADWMAAVFSAQDPSRTLQRCREVMLQQFDLAPQATEALLTQIPFQVESAASSLGLHLQDQPDFNLILRETNVRLAEENLSYQELTWRLEKTLKERDELAAELNRELELAGEIQRSLLPATNENLPICGINMPAQELSGDFYDYFVLDNGMIYFNIGDVSGKGVTAALLMAKTCSLFRCLGKQIHDPGKLMHIINAEICETSIRGMFVAMVAGLFEPKTAKLWLVNAGNPPGLLFGPNHKLTRIDANAPPLGVVPDQEFPVMELDMRASHLLLFSDGVTEGSLEAGEMLGIQGLLKLIAENRNSPPRKRMQGIVSQFRNTTIPRRDDITLLLVEDTTPNNETLVEYHFVSKPVHLQYMRKVLRTALKKIGCTEDVTDRLVLAVNEASMNIIQHAYAGKEDGRIILQVEQNPREIIFRLTDFAKPIDCTCVKSRDLDDIRPGGLGVHIIQEVMDDTQFLEHCENAGNVLVMKKNFNMLN